MTQANRAGARLICIAAVIFCLFLLYSIGTTVMGNQKVDKLTEHMQTACVGRFLIDLPAQMEYSYSQTFIAGFWVATIPESDAAFQQRVAAREAEINSEPNELGKKNMEKVEAVSVNGFSGKIFKFGRTSVEGIEKGKPIYYVNVAQEGYAHADNVTFTIKTDAIGPDQTDFLRQLLGQLRVVAPNEIPTEAGFCFGQGMLVDPISADWHEGVVMFAGFRAHPDVALAFNTRAGLGKNPYDPDPGLMVRNKRADAELPLWFRALEKTLKSGHRSISGIAGEEVVDRGTESNFTDVYTCDWEVTGTKDNVYRPDLHLEMSTGHPVNAGEPPVPSFLGSDEAVVQLWDKISSSIRVRPTKPTPVAGAKATPPGPELGDSASAGDICPETGWWQCADGDNGIGVLGGQRQFLRKGQRMPQALLLPPQTAWEKIRGVQPSYENKVPTAWALVDRRRKVRMAPDIALAPTVVQSGGADLSGTETSGTPARIGSFVRTGTPCPASGWWACQDTDALDGTRWFARGASLPPATFRVVRPKFRFTKGNVEVFQRRSTWQLVRQETEPGEAGT